jgi:hypothetical protein
MASSLTTFRRVMEGKQESVMIIECQFATSCAAWLVRSNLRSVNVRFRYPKIAVFRWHPDA